jgi:hypothetical protein
MKEKFYAWKNKLLKFVNKLEDNFLNRKFTKEFFKTQIWKNELHVLSLLMNNKESTQD